MTQARSGAVRVAVGQLIWSSHAAPAGPDAAQSGTLAAVSPTASHAVQPPRGPGRNGRRQGTALQASAAAARTPSAAETSPARSLAPAPAPSARPGPAATRPGLGAQRDLPRVDRICRNERVARAHDDARQRMQMQNFMIVS